MLLPRGADPKSRFQNTDRIRLTYIISQIHAWEAKFPFPRAAFISALVHYGADLDTTSRVGYVASGQSIHIFPNFQGILDDYERTIDHEDNLKKPSSPEGADNLQDINIDYESEDWGWITIPDPVVTLGTPIISPAASDDGARNPQSTLGDYVKERIPPHLASTCRNIVETQQNQDDPRPPSPPPLPPPLPPLPSRFHLDLYRYLDLHLDSISTCISTSTLTKTKSSSVSSLSPGLLVIFPGRGGVILMLGLLISVFVAVLVSKAATGTADDVPQVPVVVVGVAGDVRDQAHAPDELRDRSGASERFEGERFAQGSRSALSVLGRAHAWFCVADFTHVRRRVGSSDDGIETRTSICTRRESPREYELEVCGWGLGWCKRLNAWAT
ncbi:Uu.00g134810.m01.CDS01 [Anthostomella pinea]|uniref:Uu.00g134810.m01.CDS01 n=1 Tax=Anthostomella pinea TaxID=933095 RepID=A0AAI8VP00_9PEZI|nr:Uu.00g134810.m01.CDS01 [Anthostomella pinea]